MASVPLQITVEPTFEVVVVGATPTTGPFTFTFPYFEDSDIKITRVDDATGLETTLTLTTDYTITGNSVDGGFQGGTITLVATDSDATLTIYRDISVSRTARFPTSGPFDIVTLNRQMDEIFAILQELDEETDRTLKLPITEAGTTPTLPGLSDRANKYLTFNGSGEPTVTAGQSANLTSVTASGSTTSRLLQDWFADVENVLAHGASPSNTAAANDTAFAAALATGKNVYVPAGVYQLSATLTLSSGQKLFGDGVDRWLPAFPTQTKLEAVGTHLRFTGTGPTSYTVKGVTDMSLAGGQITNSDTLASHSDGTYSLTNFYNTDASGTTPATQKAFSAAIAVDEFAENWGIRDLRIYPSHNGLTDYNNTGLDTLSDDWDVGLFVPNAQSGLVENVQIVGYWRIAAYAQIVSTVGDPGSSAPRGEQNTFRHCLFQGFRGVLIRGPDVYRVTAVTTTTVEIPWTSSNPFPTSGTFRTGGANYTYTGTSQATDKLTFTGVSPDPSGAGVSPGDELRAETGSFGVSSTSFYDSDIWGLEHSSGKASSHNNIGLGVSACLEMSGEPLRGVRFIECSIRTGVEEIVAFLHDVRDVRFIGGHSEGGANASRYIATPLAGRGTYPAGNSWGVSFIGHLVSDDIDLQPFVNPSSEVTTRFPSGGFWSPRELTDTRNTFPANVNKDVIIRQFTGQSIYFEKDDGTQMVRISSAGNLIMAGGEIQNSSGNLQFDATTGSWIVQMAGTTKWTMFSSGNVNLAGAFRPATDGGHSIGSTSLHWADGWFNGVVVLGESTVAGLPSAATYQGGRTFVTDANATTFASIVAGGGANYVPVYSDGTNWRIG